MAALIGPGVDVREAGALDGLTRPEIERLAPTGRDEILVTRLQDGSAVFVGKEKIVELVEQRIAALEQGGATMTALLCTGAFPRLRSSRTLIQPHPVLLGTLRGLSWPGRLGVLTPSVPHVPQTEARWRRDGFDPVVVPLSPYEHATFSAHQMGSARMGTDPEKSVAGPYGELHDVKSVWIGDASAFPSATGTNPMATVMALAHRTAEAIAGR